MGNPKDTVQNLHPPSSGQLAIGLPNGLRWRPSAGNSATPGAASSIVHGGIHVPCLVLHGTSGADFDASIVFDLSSKHHFFEG